MILTLDVGNTFIYGGLFKNENLLFEFRKGSLVGTSADELGLFLRSILREKGIDAKEISDVGICSVVPQVTRSLIEGVSIYFQKEPFLLQAGVKTGIQIKIKTPNEMGADRIANAVGAVIRYPNKNLIIVDLGTATTIEAISSEKEHLGGAISAGLRISLESMVAKTAQLKSVELGRIDHALGKTTIEAMQSGLFFGNIGAIKELIMRISSEAFRDKPYVVIGTGGFANLFESEGIFDVIVPSLVLEGIFSALIKNRDNQSV